MAKNCPMLKARVLLAVRKVGGRVVVMEDGYRAVARLLELDDVPHTKVRNALNSLAYKPGEQPLVRHCRYGEKVFELRSS